MIILVINCGSSSLKYQLINMKDDSVMAKGLVERIGLARGVLKYKSAAGLELEETTDIPDHSKAIELVLDALIAPGTGVLHSLSEITAIGHRVVHGGEKFAASTLIDDDVVAGIRACNDLAPLHNPANLLGIEACRQLMPDAPEVAVFDTSFHQSMPEKAYLYALPYELYEKYGVRRYGFHGTSHRFVAEEAAKLLGRPLGELKLITCHIGNGASLAAIVHGKVMDTSMGMTPLEGLIMGTRSGDLDPAIIQFIMQKEGKSIAEIDKMLNKESGVLGISGVSSDFRDLQSDAENGNHRCQLALDMFYYRVTKYIGAYAAAMGGVDAIVFTAGVGENSKQARAAICAPLGFMGVHLDEARNDVRGKNAIISAEDSPVQVLLVPTNEELMIALDTQALVSQNLT